MNAKVCTCGHYFDLQAKPIKPAKPTRARRSINQVFSDGGFLPVVIVFAVVMAFMVPISLLTGNPSAPKNQVRVIWVQTSYRHSEFVITNLSSKPMTKLWLSVEANGQNDRGFEAIVTSPLIGVTPPNYNTYQFSLAPNVSSGAVAHAGPFPKGTNITGKNEYGPVSVLNVLPQ